MDYKEIYGNLITEALLGKFDVISHGTNCFCLQKAGIAKQMAEIFNTDELWLEDYVYKGKINKLGMIDYQRIEISSGLIVDKEEPKEGTLTIVNAYTQFQPGKHLDYDALTLCLRKINFLFKGKHIGLPEIGCGIAGGIFDITLLTKEQLKKIDFDLNNYIDVKTIIQRELKDMDVTIVKYKP